MVERLALVGPGIMSIPPDGWGAVEMLIWDYYKILTKAGVYVEIVNTPDKHEILGIVNNRNFDAVHVHYDVFADLMPDFKPKVKILSSHYPFINEPGNYQSDGYDKVLPHVVANTDFYIFASSKRDIDTLCSHGADRNKTFVNKLGVKSDNYHFYLKPEYDKTLCFSQIVRRKRQYLIQEIEEVEFAGRCDDPMFYTGFENYKGEIPREKLNLEIGKYSNFILLSSIENTTPLAVKEALVCGLGIIVSESVAAELDTSLNFIELVAEDKVYDLEYVRGAIQRNKDVCSKDGKRIEIRQYGIDNFDLKSIVLNSYLPKINSL